MRYFPITYSRNSYANFKKKQAFINGRAEKNPAENWYEGEIGFFDFYIITLAKKLKECGVFGVSSDEYLNYAQQNRKEWELNGKKVVENMIQSIRMETATKSLPKVSSNVNHKKPTGLSPTRTPDTGGRRAMRRYSMNAALPGNFNSTPDQGTIRRARRPSMAGGPMLPLGFVDDETKSHDSSKNNKNKSQKEDSSAAKDLPVSMSVLIVDDDKINRKLFSRSVKKIAPQWNIHGAGSGEEALEVVANAEKGFDLIFMDQYMGTESNVLLGSDTVAELRNRGNESIICGMSANDVETLFDDAGADAFIFKPLPFRQDALTRELKRILISGDDLEHW